VESVLTVEESLWWEGFVKQIGFKLGVKERGMVDDESGKSTEKRM